MRVYEYKRMANPAIFEVDIPSCILHTPSRQSCLYKLSLLSASAGSAVSGAVLSRPWDTVRTWHSLLGIKFKFFESQTTHQGEESAGIVSSHDGTRPHDDAKGETSSVIFSQDRILRKVFRASNDFMPLLFQCFYMASFPGKSLSRQISCVMAYVGNRPP